MPAGIGYTRVPMRRINGNGPAVSRPQSFSPSQRFHKTKPSMPEDIRLRLLSLASFIPSHSDNYVVKEVEVAEAVGKLGDTRGLPLLRPLLSHSNTLVVIYAAEAIGKLGDANAALNALKPLLSHSDKGVVKNAAEAVGKLGDTRGLPLLKSLLSHSNEGVVKNAAQAIGKLGDTRDLPLLKPLLSHSDEGVVIYAAEAVWKLGDADAALNALKPLLSSSAGYVAISAAKVVGKMGEVDIALDALKPLLSDSDEDVVIDAAEVIGKLGDTRSLPLLKPLLSHSDNHVVINAAQAIGKLGDTRGLPLLKPLLSHPRWDVVIYAAEAVWKLGDADAALNALKPLLSSSVGYVAISAAKVVGKMGEVDIALDALKPFLSYSDEDVVKDAAEVIGKLGDVDTALNALKPLLSYPFGYAVREAAKTVGKLGDVKGLEFIESAILTPEARSAFLKAFIDNYKPTEPTSQNPIYREATLIRAICADKYREERFEYARGFLNQGIRPGNRPDSLGYDFQEYRKLQNGEPITGRVDWNATARTGRVTEKRYQQTQASKVTIVIDPRCFRDNNPDRNKNLRLLAGTIAQMALQRKDMVGLVIGKKQVYIKPSHSKSRLLEILTRIASYTNLQTDVTIPELLEQPSVRQNMPHEAEIFFISTFEDSNLEGFSKIAEKLRKGRVHLTPIKVDNKIVMPYPVVEIGGMQYRIREHPVLEVAEEIAKEKSSETERILKISNGCLFDIEKTDKDSDIPTAVISQLTQPTEMRNLQINKRVNFQGEQVINWNKKTCIAQVTAILKDLDFIAYDRAKEQGNEYLFRYMKIQIDGFFGLREEDFSKEERDNLKELRESIIKSSRSYNRWWSWRERRQEMAPYPIELWAGKKLGRRSIMQWGPWWNVLTSFYLFHNRAKDIKKIKEQKGILSRLFIQRKASRIPVLTSDSLSPADSGVDKPKTKEDEKTWQTIKPAPHGRNAYLRNFIGVDLNSKTCGYSARKELSLDRFDAEGSKKAVGKLSAKSQVNISDLPRPVGGKIEKVDGKNIYYELGNREPEQVSRLKRMKLPEFKKMAEQVYGKEIYRALTDTISLEELDDTTRAEWKAVLNQVGNLTVKDAIKLIQSFIITHPNIKYHRYIPEEEGGKIKQVLFGEFKKRAARGNAQGKDEHLLFALQAGGGVCVEIAKITKTLLRLAGIPTALSRGWIAENGKIKVEGHTWAEVVFPKKGGKWYGEPVETSTIYLRKEIISAAKKIVKLFKQKEEKRKEEEAIPQEVKAVTKFAEALPKETHIPQVVSRLPEIWLQADHTKRIQISNWIRELPSLLDFANTNWPGTNQNVAELILEDWRNHANAHPKQKTDRMPVLKIPKDKEQMDLVLRWAGILEQII